MVKVNLAIQRANIYFFSSYFSIDYALRVTGVGTQGRKVSVAVGFKKNRPQRGLVLSKLYVKCKIEFRRGKLIEIIVLK